MVDALRAVHQRLWPRGKVVDVRPDPSRHGRVVARGRVRTLLRRSPDADHARADAAVERVVSGGLFRRVRAGTVWYSSRFTDLADLETYLKAGAGDHEYERDGHRRLAPYRHGPLTFRRAAKFQILARRSW